MQLKVMDLSGAPTARTYLSTTKRS